MLGLAVLIAIAVIATFGALSAAGPASASSLYEPIVITAGSGCGLLAGYGIMSVGAGEAHILNVCVAVDFRCRGLGRTLMLYLMRRARALGMEEAFLEVRPSNLTASRLYHALGFEQIGVRRGYYQAPAGREDASVLRCALTAIPE